MQIASIILTVIALLGTWAFVNYKKWLRPTPFIIGVGWGLLSCILGAFSVFRLLPIFYVILALALYGVFFSVVYWQSRKDARSRNSAVLSVAALLVILYAFFVAKDNLSLPIGEWSTGSYVVIVLLAGIFAALFIV